MEHIFFQSKQCISVIPVVWLVCEIVVYVLDLPDTGEDSVDGLVVEVGAVVVEGDVVDQPVETGTGQRVREVRGQMERKGLEKGLQTEDKGEGML